MITKILLIFGVAIAAIVAVAFFLRGDNEPSPTASESLGLIISSNAIYAAEQAPGRTVVISVARLEKPGFVVIHEDASGAPGQILGASNLLQAGETKNLPAITLSRATIDGEDIYAMLHLDDGDLKFASAKDNPALDPVDGEPVMMIIGINKDAAEPAGAVSL